MYAYFILSVFPIGDFNHIDTHFVTLNEHTARMKFYDHELDEHMPNRFLVKAPLEQYYFEGISNETPVLAHKGPLMARFFGRQVHSLQDLAERALAHPNVPDHHREIARDFANIHSPGEEIKQKLTDLRDLHNQPGSPLHRDIDEIIRHVRALHL